MNRQLMFDVLEDEKIRLDVFLCDNTEFTRSAIKGFIEKQNVLLFRGKKEIIVSKAGEIIKTGDKILLNAELIDVFIKPVDIPLNIIYQDEDVAVINKQQGLTVHAGSGTGDYTLVNALLFHIKNLSGINCELRPGIVHRLDKNTSGLIVIAKNDAAHASLSKQIADKTCRRIYLALCEGVFKQTEGEIAAPIARSKKDRKKMDVAPDGRFAKTNFKVLEQFEKFALVEFELITGRTHQIRVHARHINHPVLGDIVYNPNSKIKTNAQGQLLHSNKLIFKHPKTEKIMEFEAPLPEYFKI